MTNLFVFAEIRPKAAHYEDARAAIKGITEVTRRESGCLQFDLFEGKGEASGCLYLLESWADDAALQAHHEQAYTKNVFEHYKKWLADDVQLVRMRASG